MRPLHELERKKYTSPEEAISESNFTLIKLFEFLIWAQLYYHHRTQWTTYAHDALLRAQMMIRLEMKKKWKKRAREWEWTEKNDEILNDEQ